MILQISCTELYLLKSYSHYRREKPRKTDVKGNKLLSLSSKRNKQNKIAFKKNNKDLNTSKSKCYKLCDSFLILFEDNLFNWLIGGTENTYILFKGSWMFMYFQNEKEIDHINNEDYAVVIQKKEFDKSFIIFKLYDNNKYQATYNAGKDELKITQDGGEEVILKYNLENPSLIEKLSQYKRFENRSIVLYYGRIIQYRKTTDLNKLNNRDINHITFSQASKNISRFSDF